VLDPFLGSGTTMKVARELERNSIGYEINTEYLKVIKDKVGMTNSSLFNQTDDFEIIKLNGKRPTRPIPSKTKDNNKTLINHRINDPDYWKTLKNDRLIALS